MIVLSELFERCGRDKNALALSLGFLPQEIAWKAKSEYGIPLIVIADFAKKRGLKMDWLGLEYIAAREGASLKGEIEEAKREICLIL